MAARASCVCQLCQCGRHRCPHRQGTNLIPVDVSVPCTVTEYKSNYHGELAPRVQSFKPQNNKYREPEPQLVTDSTNHVDYVPHPLEKTPDFKPIRTFEAPTISMDLRSSYRGDFVGRPGQVPESCKPPHRRPGMGQFRGDNTYKVDYKEWPLSKRELLKPANELSTDTGPIFGNPTETQTNYGYPEGGKPAESMKPLNLVKKSDEPFGNPTINQTEFVEKPIPDKFVRPTRKYCPPEVPLQGDTWYREDFRGEPAERPANFKPVPKRNTADDVPLGESINKTEYTPKPLPEKFVRPTRPYEPAEIPMDMISSHRMNYDWKTQKQREPIRPKYRPPGQGAFRSETTNRVDYKGHDGQRPRPVLPVDNWEQPDVPIEGITEFKSNFKGDQIKAPSPFKPKQTPLAGGPFIADTIYNSHFNTRREIKCPAENVNHTHVFVEKQRGHNFYAES